MGEPVEPYIWEKDKIAWLYNLTYRSVSEVKFTGRRWLSPGWGQKKIYQFKYISSSCDVQIKQAISNDGGISHSEEKRFFSTKGEAMAVAKKQINKTLFRAIVEHDSNMMQLKEYGD